MWATNDETEADSVVDLSAAAPTSAVEASRPSSAAVAVLSVVVFIIITAFGAAHQEVEASAGGRGRGGAGGAGEAGSTGSAGSSTGGGEARGRREAQDKTGAEGGVVEGMNKLRGWLAGGGRLINAISFFFSVGIGTRTK